MKWVLFAYAVLLAILHSRWPTIFDPVAVGLLLLAVLPLSGVVDAIELPGLAKITFRQIEVKLRSLEVESTGIPPADGSVALIPPTPADTLNEVRMKLEARIKALAKKLSIDETLPIQDIVTAIQRQEKINGSYAKSLRDLVTIASEAAHGTTIEQKAVLYVLNISENVFRKLDSIAQDNDVR